MESILFLIRKFFSIFPIYILHKIKKEITQLEREGNGIKTKYYGQFDQDYWVIDDVFDFKKNGFFIELAAGDGIKLSNTYLLEKKYNWNGICIEANNNSFKKLKANRNCICINACVDDSVKTVKFTPVGKEIIGGIIDSDTDNKCLMGSGKFEYKKTVPLVDIFIEYNAPRIIDYFSLDVEGAEYRVLKNFPFNKYIFLAMNVERPNKQLVELLRKNGYLKVGSNFADKLFIHKDFWKLNLDK